MTMRQSECEFENGRCITHLRKATNLRPKPFLCDVAAGVEDFMLEKPAPAGPPPDNQHIYLHPRHEVVAKAELAISGAVLDQIKLHKITYTELNGILLRMASDWNKYAIRQERHPDVPDRKGDEW